MIQSFLRLMAAVLWLYTIPLASSVMAQTFQNAEDALEAVEDHALQIHTLSVVVLAKTNEMSELIETGDFRSHRQQFRKIHELLDDIEVLALDISHAANNAERYDPRLEILGLHQASIFIGTNEDFASMALMDMAAAIHEGKSGDAAEHLWEAASAMRSIRVFADRVQELSRELQRSI